MNIFCPTESAVVLAGFPNTSNVLYFPTTSFSIPGLLFAVRPLTPIVDQVKAAVSHHVGVGAEQSLSIWGDFADRIHGDRGEPLTLYLARAAIAPVPTPALEWKTLREILEAMPRGHSRVPYLRALQVLTGSLTLDTRAVETTEPN